MFITYYIEIGEPFSKLLYRIIQYIGRIFLFPIDIFFFKEYLSLVLRSS